MMKKLISVLMIFMLLCFAAGCGSDAGDKSGPSETSSEEQTVQDGEGGTTSDAQEAETQQTEEPSGEQPGDADPTVDVDLTALTSTMVYAQVYEMLTQPDGYIGKTVKVSGPFAVYTDEASGKNYFACIIQDATACCAQGMEFELKGEHSYPDDYPEQGSEITVIGTFEKYEEGDAVYCTLREAELA